MTCVLVPADSERWPEVTAIHEASATEAYRHIFSGRFPNEEAAERWRTYEGRLLLALHEGVPVGFAAWSEHVLDALYVLPQQSSRGIGTHLLAAVPTSVEALWVLVQNTRGRAFYERHGWVNSGLVRPAYEPVDEVLYQREVAAAAAASGPYGAAICCLSAVIASTGVGSIPCSSAR